MILKLLMKFDLNCDRMTQNYRFVIVSYIKSLLSAKYPQDFERLFSSPLMKSYTFSVFFPDGRIEKDYVTTPQHRMNVTVSGWEADLIVKLYNAALVKRGGEYPVPGGKMVLSGVHLSTADAVLTPGTAIKFLSPLLVRRREDKADTYLSYGDEEFAKYLNISVNNLFKSMGLTKPEGEVSLTPLKAYTTVVKSNGLMHRANCGSYVIQGNAEVLKVLYHTGLGARRGQGFGMMEISEVCQ